VKPYQVTVEVTTTYTVEVHAEDEEDADNKTWKMDSDEIEAQGSAYCTEIVSVSDIEEIQREDGK